MLLRNLRIPSLFDPSERRGEERKKKEKKERRKRKRKEESFVRGERKKPKGWSGTAQVWFEPVSPCHGHATFHPNVAGYKEIDLTTIMYEYLCAFNERNYPKYIYIRTVE